MTGMEKPVIGFAGLSHLGICSAAAAAAKGFEVIGFDPDRDLVTALERGDLPVHEPGLDDLWSSHRARLALTDDVAGLRECDIVYLSLDVPTDDGTGLSDLTAVRSLIDGLEPGMSDQALLVVLAQVPPGFTRGLGRDPARTFYQVETLVFGDAVARALNPERIIVGCADPGAGLPARYLAFLEAFDCPLLTMAYESAEITKISINCMLTAAVSTSNMLAELCEKLGGDWNEVIPALQQDRRIGPYAYLKPGLGIAGGNLERDLATVADLAGRTGSNARMIDAMRDSSAYHRDWVLRQLGGLPAADHIAFWGLAYKAGTASLKNAPSLDLIRALSGTEIRAHDYQAGPVELENLTRVEDPLAALEGADILVVMTPDPRYRALPAAALTEALGTGWVFDPFGVLDETACRAAGLNYRRIGAQG